MLTLCNIMIEFDLYQKLVVFVFVWAALTYFFLSKVSAPYGKFKRKGWGPSIPNNLGWIIFETPSVVLFAYVFFKGQYANNLVPLIFFTFWQIHYINRTYIFPLRIKTKGKTTPILIVLSAIFFTSLNSYINARWISNFHDYQIDWLKDPRFILGSLILLSGIFINIQSDNILLSLRKPEETGYKIPNGGLFKFVSGPNYLGELLVWLGWAIATWSLAGLGFFVFTFSNLFPRALSSHKWYQEKFPEYPKNRKAIIPGLI
jgi:protein-S-isoprenylcysteine O-methyltransferase Ste14